MPSFLSPRPDKGSFETSNDKSNTDERTSPPRTRRQPPELKAVLHIQDLIERQRGTLNHIEFLSANASELDDPINPARARLAMRYPMIPQEEWGPHLATVARLREMKDWTEESVRPLAEGLFDVAGDHDLASLILDLFQASEGLKMLPRVFATQLTALVADFEVFCGNILQLLVTTLPPDFIEDNLSVSWGEIRSHGDFSSLKEKLAKQRFDNMLRKGLAGWLAAFAKFNVRLPGQRGKSKSHGNRGPSNSTQTSLDVRDLHEIFQRRHMIIHNGGTVSEEYISRMREHDPEFGAPVGSQLPVDATYLRWAADILLAFGFCLGSAACDAVIKVNPDAKQQSLESLRLNMIYELLLEKRPRACRILCEVFSEARFETANATELLFVNRLLSMIDLGEKAEAIREADGWVTADLDPSFKLAKLIILELWPSAEELARDLLDSGAIPAHQWLTWPLASPLRTRGVMPAALRVDAPEESGAA